MSENGENNELFQKYCAHIGGRVTVMTGKNGAVCLSSHLCHGQKCENRNLNSRFSDTGKMRIDINEK